MLTSKLILISFTWGMAFLVSVLLRIAGILHPETFYVSPSLVWLLVFGPSFLFLIYFLVKRSISLNYSN